MRTDAANSLLISADLRISAAGREGAAPGAERSDRGETGDAEAAVSVTDRGVTGRAGGVAAEVRRSAETRADVARFMLVSADLRVPAAGWGPAGWGAAGWGPAVWGAAGWGPADV